MPPKKPSAFIEFVKELHKKHGKKITFEQATKEAGEKWKNMTEEERLPYKERVKGIKVSTEKYTCTGVPISIVENHLTQQEQASRAMKRHINSIVRNSMARNELEEQKYYFIAVNYFAKNLKDSVYIPAEISICEFSLKEGASTKYHTFINPGKIYGHSYEALSHSENTHKLPLPPNALGEVDPIVIRDCILEFIGPRTAEGYPPLFTLREAIPIVETSMIYIDDELSKLKIYPVQQLFYDLKVACCEVGENAKPESQFLTDAYFERDPFEFTPEIACDYHLRNDRVGFCTLSLVTRWAYCMCEYMALDIALKCIPGKHLPIKAKHIIYPEKKPEVKPEVPNWDTESTISNRTTTSAATSYVAERRPYNDNSGAPLPSVWDYGDTDFPALPSSASQRSNHSRDIHHDLDRYDDSNVNYWSRRSREVPREPSHADFDINLSRRDRDSLGSINTNTGRIIKKGFGRGTTFRR